MKRWSFVAVLFGVSTWNYFDYNVLAVTLEPIKREFFVSDTALGLLSGIGFAVFYALASLPLARWGDRGNRRTLIALTLGVWSAMTALCGLSQTFVQLVLARLGVAMTEPGAAPPSQSLVVDYLPPGQRGLGIALLSIGGSSAGYCIGVGVGGYVADTLGWRMAFILAGLPGILFALIARFMLAEPRLRLGFPGATQVGESILESLKKLRAKRCYVLTLVGLCFLSIFGYGTSVFLPSYMIRVLHASLRQVSVTWGFAVALGLLLGAVIGGHLADRLSRRDIRWCVWLPAISYAVGAPLYWITLTTHRLNVFIVLDSLAEMVLATGTAVAFVAIQPVCGSQRRAVAVSVTYFAMMLIGCGLGPLISGMLSDHWALLYGGDSLRPALTTLILFLIPASVVFWYAGAAIRRDLEE